MATTTAVTCTEKRGSIYGDAYEVGSVYTRTFTFPVLTAAGYESGDTLTLDKLPENSIILGAAAKTTVTQGSATFALNVTGTAFATATAITSTTSFQAFPLTAAQCIVPSTAGGTAISCVIASANCAAATITLTIVLASLGIADAAATTYSN
jgi:hypothetical protein